MRKKLSMLLALFVVASMVLAGCQRAQKETQGSEEREAEQSEDKQIEDADEKEDEAIKKKEGESVEGEATQDTTIIKKEETESGEGEATMKKEESSTGSVQTEIKIDAGNEQSQNAVKEFTITAKKWNFSPSTITAQKGDTVKLAVKSIDVNHGFAIPEFNVSEKLEPGKTVNIEFVADKTGTFTFLCNVFCGAGHSTMRGTFIVE